MVQTVVTMESANPATRGQGLSIPLTMKRANRAATSANLTGYAMVTNLPAFSGLILTPLRAILKSQNMFRAPIANPAAKPGTMELSKLATSPAMRAQTEAFTRPTLEDIRIVGASRPTDASFKPILPGHLVYVPEARG